MEVKTRFLDWSDAAQAYTEHWGPYNQGFFKAAIEQLPDMKEEGTLLVPGAGPGLELPQLMERYPGRLIVASDPSLEMIRAIKARAGEMTWTELCTEVKPLEELEPASGDAAVSFFTVHTLRDPVEAILTQTRAVRPGGWSAAVYFPPIPEPGGPLAALYRAARMVRPKDPPDWEARLCDAIRGEGCTPLAMQTLRQTWEFDSPFFFRELMEMLPHQQLVRKKVGEASFEAMWQSWLEDPGLGERDGRWVGEAAARLMLIAC